MMEATHLLFSDESKWNIDRYRAVSSVSFEKKYYGEWSEELISLLKESNINEFKWKKLKGAKGRKGAKKLIDFVFDKIKRNLLKIDILIWDIECPRHKIKNRDDVRNLGRMYHHLFHFVLSNKWKKHYLWNLHPDENSDINWKLFHKFLLMKKDKVKIREENLFKKELIELFKDYDVLNCVEKDSKQEPFIQIADLFAGLGAYSWERFEQFRKWKEKTNPQAFLWESKDNSTIVLSNIDKERCPVLDYLNSECKKISLTVGLDKSKGLKTYNHMKPINFWIYETQGYYDKAPRKIKEKDKDYADSVF